MPLNNQEDLDYAVRLVERNDYFSNALNLILNSTNSGASCSLGDCRHSPPPGSLPDDEGHHMYCSPTFSSGGQFIPEQERITLNHHNSDSHTSLDSSKLAIHRLRDRSRLTCDSDFSGTDELLDGTRACGGTFPKCYSSVQMREPVDGRQTFPRVGGRQENEHAGIYGNVRDQQKQSLSSLQLASLSGLVGSLSHVCEFVTISIAILLLSLFE